MGVTSYRDHEDGRRLYVARLSIEDHRDAGDVDWLADALLWMLGATVELLDGVEDVPALVAAVKLRLRLASER